MWSKMLAFFSAGKEDASRISSRQWFQYKFNKSMLRVALEVINTFMSVLSVSVYVYDTYVSIDDVARIIYLTCSCTFSVEYVAKLLAANDWLSYMFWDWSLIDVATIAYGIAYYVNNSVSNDLGFIRLLRIIQVVRLCKSITFIMLQYSRHTSQPMQLEFVRRSADLAVTLVAVVFISGCVFYELEQVQEGLSLHTAIYWACVTISTIGYGDYAPETVAGHLMFPLVIIIVILILPRKISDLFEVMHSFSRFVRRSHRSHHFGQHVLLTGHVTSQSAQTFIGEFYHQGRGYQDMDVVLLCPNDPEPSLVIALNNPRWEHRVKYLNGSPYQAEDLARADTGRALAVFVLADKYAADPAAEDNRTLLAVLAVAQFLRQFGSPEDLQPPRVVNWSATSWKGRYNCSDASSCSHPNIVAQFLLSETLNHAIALLRSGARHPPELGLIPLDVSPFPICVGSLRASLLGAALHTPGLIAFISNLCISASLKRRSWLGHREDVSMLTNCGWLSEYFRGASVEIYDVTFPESFWGLTFKQAALKLWREEEVILIGLHPTPGDKMELSLEVKLAPMGSWAARHVASVTAADLQQSRAADAAADEVGQLPQLQPRFFHSQSRSKLQPPAQQEEVLVDGHTVGYILSADALVLGSGSRRPLAAEEKVEAMWRSTTGMQHQHQQQQQAEPQHQRRREEQTHQSPPQLASPLITPELANQRLQRAQQWLPGAPVKHTASGTMAAGTTAISSPRAVTRLRCDKATIAPSGTTTTGEMACAKTDATTAGHKTAAISATTLTMAAATVAAGAGAAAVVEDTVGNHGAILERIPAAAPSFCSGTSVECGLWSWSAATCSHNPSLLQLTASAPPPPSPSPQQQQNSVDGTPSPSSAASRRGAIGSLPPATQAAGLHTGTVAPSPAVAVSLPAVASSTTARARPFWWQLASMPREHSQHTEPCSDTQQSGLVKLTVEDWKPNRVTETNPPARQAKWIWRPSFRSEGRLGHITASKRDVSGAGSASGGFTSTDASTTGGGASGGASTKRQQGLKATTRAPDLHALAAVSSATYKRATEQHMSKTVMDAVQGRPSDSDSDLDLSFAPPSGARPVQGPSCLQPRILDTFADREALDSPVLILGSSCFIQLAQLVGAIRSAPPVGYGESFRTRTMVIIADSAEDGKAALGSKQLAALGSLPGALPDHIFVLRADPRDATDLEKLNLKPGCSVAAVLVPSTEQFAKGGVKGAAPALADGQLLVAAAALRRYCDQLGCRLRVVAEVLALLNCSYALPLCLEEGPYHTNNLTGTQQLHSYRRPASSLIESPDPLRSPCNHVKFVTDPRPDFRRVVRMTLKRLRRFPDEDLQEEFVQEMLSHKPNLTPSLAPGHILMETFMDALACQSIFNPMILQILLKMLNCWTATPTHHRRARLQNHHPHHHSHQQQQQQPFQHEHQKQARRFHLRQQSHPHVTPRYSRYLQLRHLQHPQVPQRPPLVSPSQRRKEHPDRSITRGVPVVASSSPAPSSSPALFLEGRPKHTQMPLVASPHPGAVAASSDYVSGSILNPVLATGCQSISISLAAPAGPAGGTAPRPCPARLTTSESPQTQSPPPPSAAAAPTPPVEPVPVKVPSSLQQASHNEATVAVKASTRGPARFSRSDGSGIGISRQSAIAAASAATTKG
ncbi:hypothetical protein VaNZ11_003381, partial [Volvox africanus]